jgi:hypothetical protein
LGKASKVRREWVRDGFSEKEGSIVRVLVVVRWGGGEGDVIG